MTSKVKQQVLFDDPHLPNMGGICTKADMDKSLEQLAADDDNPFQLYDAVALFRKEHPALEPPIKQTIYGNPPSKSNSYRIVTFKPAKGSDAKAHSHLAKTPELKKYENDFNIQCQVYRNKMLQGRLCLELNVWYSSERPDTDGCLKAILDCLQQVKAYKNDRQVRRIILESFVDKTNPRIEFFLYKHDKILKK